MHYNKNTSLPVIHTDLR